MNNRLPRFDRLHALSIRSGPEFVRDPSRQVATGLFKLTPLPGPVIREVHGGCRRLQQLPGLLGDRSQHIGQGDLIQGIGDLPD